jgi:hypothetical protein
MATDYRTLKKNVTAAIEHHLMSTDILPPRAELTNLAGELTQVVFNELQHEGLNAATWNRIDTAPAETKVGALGVS